MDEHFWDFQYLGELQNTLFEMTIAEMDYHEVHQQFYKLMDERNRLFFEIMNGLYSQVSQQPIDHHTIESLAESGYFHVVDFTLCSLSSDNILLIHNTIIPIWQNCTHYLSHVSLQNMDLSCLEGLWFVYMRKMSFKLKELFVQKINNEFKLIFNDFKGAAALLTSGLSDYFINDMVKAIKKHVKSIDDRSATLQYFQIIQNKRLSEGYYLSIDWDSSKLSQTELELEQEKREEFLILTLKQKMISEEFKRIDIRNNQSILAFRGKRANFYFDIFKWLENKILSIELLFQLAELGCFHAVDFVLINLRICGFYITIEKLVEITKKLFDVAFLNRDFVCIERIWDLYIVQFDQNDKYYFENRLICGLANLRVRYRDREISLRLMCGWSRYFISLLKNMLSNPPKDILESAAQKIKRKRVFILELVDELINFF